MIPQVNKLILAPMEGVLDHLMRSILCSLNSYDLCIIEFIRVVDSVIPKHVFYRTCPELLCGGLTSSNTPIRVQLLGQEPNWMAENAIRAIELGSHGIDLNFGCPAKTVNKSKGGAILLTDPEQIYKIISTVKQSLERSSIVSAKIRLGFNDTSLINEIVHAVQNAGADLLTIHARTKADGYRPPAYWHLIGEITEKLKIEIVSNGEIWNKQSALDCMIASKTNNLMLGRGALSLPNLANVIRLNEEPMPWNTLCTLLIQYSELELVGDKSYYFSSRLKQWLRYLKLQYSEAELLFNSIKTMKNKQDIIYEVTSLLDM